MDNWATGHYDDVKITDFLAQLPNPIVDSGEERPT